MNGWKNFLQDHIRGDVSPPAFEGELGAVLYNHAGAFTLEEVDKSKELNDLIFSDEISLEKKLKILDDLYNEEMIHLNRGFGDEPINSLLEEYDWYLREDRSEELLKSWLGDNVDDEFIDFFGYHIVNPLLCLHNFKGFNQETKIGVKNIHGDLHPRNIILDKKYQPRLIDFEWASRGHALKDYALFECSLKFFQLKKNLPLVQLLKFEKLLIDFRKEEDFKDTFGDIISQEIYDVYIMIQHIRAKAKDFCIWKNNNLEYLCALFLISYGLLYLEECNTLYCLISLGLISEKLLSCNVNDLLPNYC